MKSNRPYHRKNRLNDPDTAEESEAEMLLKLAQDDAELLQRYVRHGDESAFVELSGRYHGLILNVAKRVTGNTHDAEDVAQLVLLEFARDAAGIHTNLPGWLRNVTVRRAFRWRKESIRRTLAEAIVAEERHELSSRPADEISHLVRMSIDELPDRLRIAFKLRFFEGRSYRQIATLLRLNSAHVKEIVNDAVRILRRSLTAYGVPVTASVLVCCLNDSTSAEPIDDPAHDELTDGAETLSEPSVAHTTSFAATGGRLLAVAAQRWKLLLCVGLFAIILTGVLVVLNGWSNPLSLRPSAYDMLRESYSPYADVRDPLGFGAKIADMTASETAFWNGSKIPLIRWCRENAPEWVQNANAQALSPGRVDPAAIGWYATSDQARPYQIGLLDRTLDDVLDNRTCDYQPVGPSDG